MAEGPGQPTAGIPETILDEPAWLRVGSWIVCPILGAVAALLLRAVAGWVASLPWVPFQGPFKLVASIPEPQASLGAVAIGLIAGVAFAAIWARDRLVVTVSATQVTLRRGDTVHRIDRAQVDAVFLDGKKLVLLGDRGNELARESSDLEAEPLREAFSRHGLRWLDEDPYAGDYRLWVEDTPGLPAGANALLKARQRALDKGDADDLATLRAELLKLDVVVREERKHQYWRLSTPAE